MRPHLRNLVYNAIAMNVEAERPGASGLKYMVVGAFWFSVMSLLVKLAGRRIPSMEIVLFRGLVTLLLSWLTLRHSGVANVWGQQPRLLVLRGTLGAAALACFLFSLTHLPLGEATLIHYTNPVFAILIAGLWYREPVGKGELVALAASLVGVVMVTRPAFLFGGAASGIPTSWIAIALLGAAFSGAAYATIRRMSHERPEVVVLYLPLMSIPMSLPFLARGWVTPNLGDILLLVATGLATQLAQTAITRGLQLERTSRATTAGYLQIVFAGLWGVLFFDERPSLWTLLGAAVIVAGTLILILSRREVVQVEE
jgi:drug/metabolite transporter (DMT)-like permease